MVGFYRPTAWASALFIFGSGACEGLIRGIGDELDTRASFFMGFQNSLLCFRWRYQPEEEQMHEKANVSFLCNIRKVNPL